MMQFFGSFGSIEACETALSIAAHNSQVAAPRVTIGSSGGVPAGLAQTVSDEVVALASRVFSVSTGRGPQTRRSLVHYPHRELLVTTVSLLHRMHLKRVWDRTIIPAEPAKPGDKPAITAASSSALTTYRPPGTAATSSTGAENCQSAGKISRRRSGI